MHDAQLQQAVERAQELIDRLDGHSDAAIRDAVFELLQHIDTLHREGLGRLCGMLRAAGHDEVLALASQDEAVALLLGLYDLGPRAAPPPAETAPAPPSKRRLFHIEGLEEAFLPDRRGNDEEEG